MTDVHRRIDGVDIIRGIDWDISRDQRWVVLGPNGSGKTTLARMAALRLHPTSGTLTVLGHELGKADIRPLLPKIGYASASLADQLRPQIAAVDVVMTAKNGALEPWWHEYSDADQSAARHALARVGADGLADQHFGSCSSGEKQRILIARALMTDPALLLLDEPTAALDLRGREEFVQTLERLAAEPDAPAMALITHHVDEIPPSFDHALLVRDGRVLASGPIESTLTDELLSKTFDLALQIRREGSRWSARSVPASAG